MQSVLGDVTYRLPKADEWTNLAYLLGALAPMSIIERGVVGCALLAVCAGSWAWHYHENVLSRRFDEMGMMMALSSIALLLAGRIAEPLFGAVTLSVVPWGFYYLNLHRTSSFHHIAGWSVVILGQMIWLVGWLAALPVVLFAIGLWGQFSAPWNDARYGHGTRHGIAWHIPTGLALASIIFLCGQ